MFGLSLGHLLIVLLVVVLIFGTKKLKNIGGDLGGAINEFKKAMNDDQKDGQVENKAEKTGTTIEGEVTDKTKQ